MRPINGSRSHAARPTARGALGIVVALASLAGCAATPLFDRDAATALDEATQPETTLVSDVAHPFGLTVQKVEAVALVTGLDGTGEDPPQSPQRAALLDQMHRERVERPNELLRSKDTGLVLLRGYLPPGVSKGDRFDVEVRVSSRSKTSSLRGGWVMPTRMTPLQALGQQIREGHVLANASGAILVDPSADPDEEAAIATRGRILGGGVARKSRPLGLVIAQDHQSVRMTQAVAKAINNRFQTYLDGRKSGVAEAKTDEFIELRLHPRYKDNVTRFVRVVRSLPLRETPGEQQERVALLAKQVLDPLTASSAALRLEAIGGDLAIGPLQAAVQSTDPEVRFYAAEALAYLDHSEAVEPLREAAVIEPAFRAHALAALGAMDDIVAYDALRSLLTGASAETRYGAFRALKAMNASDPLIRGDKLGGHFAYHVLDVEGAPMVHATRSGRPELVLFGAAERFRLPMVLDAGRDILVNGLSGDEVTVSRFRVGEPAMKRTVTRDVDAVVRAIVDVGGDYPDVVQALQQAKRDGALTARFAVDAIPISGREYDREELRERSGDRSDGDGAEDDSPEDAEAATADDRAMDANYRVATPLPDLFSTNKR